MDKSHKASIKARRLRECEGGFWTFHSMTRIPQMGAYNCMNAAVPCAAAQYSFRAEDLVKANWDVANTMNWRWGYCENTTANSAPWNYGANNITWRYSTSPSRRMLKKEVAKENQAKKLKAAMAKAHKSSIKARRLRECEGGMWTFHSNTHIAPMGTAWNCMNAAVPCGSARYSFQAEDLLKADYDVARSMDWRWGYCDHTTSNSPPWQYGANNTTWRYSLTSSRRLAQKSADKHKAAMDKSHKASIKARRLRECEGGFWTFHSMTRIPQMGAYNCMNAAVPCAAAQYSFRAEDLVKANWDVANTMNWRWGYCENTTANSAPWNYGA